MIEEHALLQDPSETGLLLDRGPFDELWLEFCDGDEEEQREVTALPQEKVLQFQERLLTWYRRGRRLFPWRDGRRNAYQLLIAEIMLRKTDAGKAAHIYEEFIRRYGGPASLAAADEAELRDEIRLLGIADRARLLKLMGQQLMEVHHGRIPSDYRELVRLPGIGPYTANAVLCFAYRRDVPLLDTNIIRIIDRVFGIRSDKPRPRCDSTLWRVAADLVPAGRSISYNRSLLDFAASVCTLLKPKCEQCPLRSLCDYAQKDLTG